MIVHVVLIAPAPHLHVLIDFAGRQSRSPELVLERVAFQIARQILELQAYFKSQSLCYGKIRHLCSVMTSESPNRAAKEGARAALCSANGARKVCWLRGHCVPLYVLKQVG